MSDLIDRQAVMQEFADFVRRSNNSDFAQTPTWNDAVSLVEAMPPAQPEQVCIANITLTDDQVAEAVEKAKNAVISVIEPERKTGRWLGNYQYGYKCSECGAYLEIDCGDVEMNYCPNCGADMREGEAEC